MPDSEKGPIVAVVQKYGYYQQLVQGLKRTSAAVFVLNNLRKANDDYYGADASVQHDALTVPLVLKITQHRLDVSNFHFVLVAGDFRDRGLPIFRLDSRGHTHENPDYYPLTDRQIITPHFHIFDENGYNIAYRTQLIVEYETLSITPNIKDFINHFYDEANIINQPDSYPIVRLREEALQTPQLPFPTLTDTRKSDPLRYADF